MSDWPAVGAGSTPLNVNLREIIAQGRFCVLHPAIYDGMEVVVKKVTDPQRSKLEKEIECLKHFDDPYIVRYKVVVRDRYFSYIVLERCVCSLGDWISGRHIIPQLKELSIFKQVCRGLHYLHSKAGIIHRNIHPSNILVSLKQGEYKMRLSDFGLVKESSDGDSVSCSETSGNLRYCSPEERKGEHISPKTDIFPLALCSYAVLSNGENPYGDDDVDIDHRIRSGIPPNLTPIAEFHHGYAIPLIKSMLRFRKEERPGIEEVLAHYLFWDRSKTSEFFQIVSNDIIENRKFSLRTDMDAVSYRAIGAWQWQVALFQNLMSEDVYYINEAFKKYPPFDGVCGLLRVIRNWTQHYQKLNHGLKIMFGKVDIPIFFANKFPMLLPETYEVFRKKKQNRRIRTVLFLSRRWPLDRSTHDQPTKSDCIGLSNLLLTYICTEPTSFEIQSDCVGLSNPSLTYICTWTASFYIPKH